VVSGLRDCFHGAFNITMWFWVLLCVLGVWTVGRLVEEVICGRVDVHVDVSGGVVGCWYDGFGCADGCWG